MPDKRFSKNKLYTLRRNEERVGDFKTIKEVAAFIGCTPQNIQQNKRGAGVYSWKDYTLTKSQSWEADALLKYKRLARYVINPATASKVYLGLKNLLAEIEGGEL